MYTISINKLNWNIKLVDEKSKFLMQDNLEQVLGITHFNDLTIYISNKINTNLLIRTLRHELTHAFLFSYGFVADDMKEESICNFIEVYGQDIIDISNSIKFN